MKQDGQESSLPSIEDVTDTSERKFVYMCRVSYTASEGDLCWCNFEWNSRNETSRFSKYWQMEDLLGSKLRRVRTIQAKKMGETHQHSPVYGHVGRAPEDVLQGTRWQMLATRVQEIQMLFLFLEIMPYFALFGGKVVIKTPYWILWIKCAFKVMSLSGGAT